MSYKKKSALYSLKKSTRLLCDNFSLFEAKKKELSQQEETELKNCYKQLQTKILEKDAAAATLLAKKAENLSALYLKKTFFQQTKDLLFSLTIALTIAIVVRQCWFEPYGIPSGSMRPTLKEQDKLLVTKTSFGINVPLRASHITFNPDLVKRSDIIIFSGENMPIQNNETHYFYIFPSYRQYVKRLMGKPGDLIYFYGGKLYGVDQNGKDISNELQFASSYGIDFIPFIRFEWKWESPRAPVRDIYGSVNIFQMNEPIARLYVKDNSQAGAEKIEGEMINLKEIRAKGAPPVTNYADLWGIGNYAEARLLSAEQVKNFQRHKNISTPLPTAKAYLELTHTPKLTTARLSGRDAKGKRFPTLGISTTHVPLNDEHLKALADTLYTARFIVKNGFTRKEGSNRTGPKLPDVPDGTYEFYFGKAYKVGFGAITTELPKSHPLYKMDFERLQTFYNLGIDFDPSYIPKKGHQQETPSRYAYFRDGDLFTMGSCILKKEDPLMDSYLTYEKQREEVSPIQKPYTPFIDRGAPLKADGTIDLDKIRQFGLKIPEKSYLALGDNHAMSGDSRVFGFVPEENIQGSPSLLIWPPGNRLGLLNQPKAPIFVPQRIAIWALFALCTLIWYLYQRKRYTLPLKGL